MKKISKKLSKTVKDQLRFIVEEFLERSGPEITAITGSSGYAAKTMWEKLERSLFANSFWMDEVEPEHKADINYEKLLEEYHAFLKPTWGQFRDALFDYKYNIIPAREKLRRARKTTDRDEKSAFSEFKDLLKQDTVLDWEKFYDITLTVSFEPGRVSFYKRSMNVVKNFMDLLSGVDIDYFARCEHCGKCIVVSRAGKRFCPGCAAKKYQKEKWQQDPEGMRKKERLRYQEKRKMS
ncbi:MAG: hypothetical protein JRE65_03980 [Deltaproteobacteria bacterium]|jgi:hypothetical protein|nr:hypothetical protein [Deltaproteobacteria bacterium]